MKAGWMLATVFMAASVIGMANNESGIEFEVTTDFYSKYVWRGQKLTDGWVWQPGFSATYEGFTAGIWGNLDLSNANDEKHEFTEIDYYADYSFDLTDGIGFSIGYIYYEFPSAGGDTQEIYAGLSFDTILSPTITVYYDFDEVNGTYITGGIGYSKDEIARLCEDTPIGLDISLSIGWGDSNYNEAYWSDSLGMPVDDSGFNDLTLCIGFPLEIDGWSFTPSLSYVTLLDSDIRDGLRSDDKDMFFTGFSIGKSF